jgi:hypothetical protein
MKYSRSGAAVNRLPTLEEQQMRRYIRTVSSLLQGVILSVAAFDLKPLRRSLMLIRLHAAFGLVEVEAAQSE